MKKNIDINPFYVYNIEEVHNIQVVEGIKSIMGNPNED